MSRPAEALRSVDSGLRALSINVLNEAAPAHDEGAEATAVSLLQNRGLAHLQLGDWSGAVAAYEHAEKLLPTAKLGKMIERAYQCSAAATLAQLTGEAYFWKREGAGRHADASDDEAVVTLLCATPALAERGEHCAGAASDTSDEGVEKSPSGVDEYGRELHPFSELWHPSSSDSDDS